MTAMCTLGFTGDVMLGRVVNDRQRTRPVDAVWGNVLDRLRSLDGLFINLECCLSTRGTKWSRTNRPFHFRANPDWAIPALKRAGVDWASLANNHLMDYEEVALRDTLDHLDAAGIAHSGAGVDLAGARELATVSLPGLDVTFVSFTDNTPEFAAGPNSPGTAHVEFDLDDEESVSVVRTALDRAHQSNPDFVVASLHWGPNMVERPPTRFREFGRWLVDNGVDLVHGHSAHVFHGVELYDGAPILYDTGDFVDDYAVDSTLRNDRSFLFQVTVDSVDGRVIELRLLPTQIDDYAVHEAPAGAAEWSRKRMRRLSEPFGTTFERDGNELVLAP